MKPTPVMEQTRIAVASDPDIVAARTRGRAMATQLGFRATDATLIATAISELARNILLYARSAGVSQVGLLVALALSVGVVMATACGGSYGTMPSQPAGRAWCWRSPGLRSPS